MTIGDSFKQSNLLNLADTIQNKVLSPLGIKINTEPWSAEIRAFLNLSHDGLATSIDAHCIISIHDNWMLFMPSVKCREHWVKRDIDWHIGPDGELCYDIDLRWRDKVGQVMNEEGMKAASNFAAEWCLHHSRVLLWRHYYAYTINMEKWQADWPAWGHGEAGRKEYRLGQMLKHMK